MQFARYLLATTPPQHRAPFLALFLRSSLTKRRHASLIAGTAGSVHISSHKKSRFRLLGLHVLNPRSRGHVVRLNPRSNLLDVGVHFS